MLLDTATMSDEQAIRSRALEVEAKIKVMVVQELGFRDLRLMYRACRLFFAELSPMKKDQCANCLGEAHNRCGKCQLIRYCCKECQQEDWPHHKRMCKQYQGIIHLPSGSRLEYSAERGYYAATGTTEEGGSDLDGEAQDQETDILSVAQEEAGDEPDKPETDGHLDVTTA